MYMQLTVRLRNNFDCLQCSVLCSKELVDKPLIIHSHCNIKKVFFLDQRVVYLIKFNNDRNIYDTSPDVSLF